MNKYYKISSDGTIFGIGEDGSISKIAKIDDNGNIPSLADTHGPAGKNNRKKTYLLIIFLLFSISVVLGILCISAFNDVEYYRGKYYSTSEELLETESILEDISLLYPLVITDIEIGNIYNDGKIQTDYGKRIYDYNTMYLQPKISYIGLTTGTRTLKVKWFTPGGYLSRGSSSPYGFSQSDDELIRQGKNTLILSGWGNDNKGNWSSGTYRIEIWYKNTCLKSETFTIY